MSCTRFLQMLLFELNCFSSYFSYRQISPCSQAAHTLLWTAGFPHLWTQQTVTAKDRGTYFQYFTPIFSLGPCGSWIFYLLCSASRHKNESEEARGNICITLLNMTEPSPSLMPLTVSAADCCRWEVSRIGLGNGGAIIWRSEAQWSTLSLILRQITTNLHGWMLLR